MMEALMTLGRPRRIWKTTMAASPGQEPPDDKRAGVRGQIAILYKAYALAIADALGDKPLCVATGPRRFGKTTSLLPALAGVLRGRGKAAHTMNGRDYEGESFTVETLPPERFDVLIIDEANVLTRTKRQIGELLRCIHTKGDAIVPVITHYAGYESSALSLARIWQEADFPISQQMANVVCLPQMIVSSQIARDLLTLYSPIRDEAVRVQVVTYVVERAPLNPHVLLELAGARSVAEVNAFVRSRKRTLFQHALSPDEYRRLEQSLEE